MKTVKSPHLVVELQLRKKIRPTGKITLLIEVLVKCEDLNSIVTQSRLTYWTKR